MAAGLLLCPKIHLRIYAETFFSCVFLLFVPTSFSAKRTISRYSSGVKRIKNVRSLASGIHPFLLYLLQKFPDYFPGKTFSLPKNFLALQILSLQIFLLFGSPPPDTFSLLLQLPHDR